jgi:hypothetical protein
MYLTNVKIQELWIRFGEILKYHQSVEMERLDDNPENE